MTSLSHPQLEARRRPGFARLIHVIMGGYMPKKDAMREIIRKASYNSVRPYTYSNNHFPIQDFYLQDASKDSDGALTLKTVAAVLKNVKDNFVGKRAMRW